MRSARFLLRFCAGLLSLAALAIGALLATAQYAPQYLVPLVERGGSYILGRDLSLGELAGVSLGADLALELRDLELADAPWAGPGPMLQVGRLRLALNLPSLWREGAVLLHEVELEGFGLRLLAPADKEPNWSAPVQFFSGEEDDEPDDLLFPVVIEWALLADISLTYVDPDQEVDLSLEHLTLDRDEISGLSRLELTGIVNELPLRGGGLVGPTQALQSGRNLELDVLFSLGEMKILAAGAVADALALSGADLRLDVSSPRSRAVLDILGLHEVRDGPMQFQGRLEDGDPGLRIDAEGELADFGLGVHGRIGNPAGLDDVDIEFYLDGPSMAEAGAILGVTGFKNVPFDVAGSLYRAGSLLRLKDGRLRADQGQLSVSGQLPQFPDIDDWQAKIAGTQLDLSVLGALLGTDQLPQLVCDLEGRLFSDGQGAELVDLRVTDGDLTLVVDGVMGELPDYHNTNLKVQFTGNDLTRLKALVGLETLPVAPFKLAGVISRDADSWWINKGELHSPGLRADITAELDRLANPQRVNGRLRISSPDFPAALREYGSGFDTLVPLPLDLTGEARLVGGGFELSAVSGQVGAMTVSAQGLLSDKAGLAGSRISLQGRGDNFGDALAAFAGGDLPGQPFSLALDGVYHAPLVEVGQLKLDIGAHTLSGHLTLAGSGEQQVARGQVSLSGDSARDLLTLAGLELDVLDGAYRTAADLEMSADHLTVRNLDADLLNSHLGGELSIAFGARPRLDMDLHSRELHLPSFWPALDETGASTPDAGAPNLMEPPTRADMQDRLIPETPLPLDWIKRVDGEWRYRIDNAWAREVAHARMLIDLTIEDGVLQTKTLGWEGTASEGWVDLRVDARQIPYRADLTLASDRIPMLWLIAGKDIPKQKSTYRGRLSLVGGTVREAAASLDGELLLQASGAQLSNKGLDLVLGDVVGSVFDRINPFTATQEYTEVECLTGAMRARKGLVTIDPGAVVRMDKIDVVSHGTVDLNTEALNIAFNTRSRKGIGISAGKAITPYLKVAGNLAHPWLTVDPEAVALSGTAAIATGGLSILAEGLYDRWIATADNPCMELFRQIRRDPDYQQILALPEPGLTASPGAPSIDR